MWCDRQKTVIIFVVFGKFSEMSAGTKKGQFGSGSCHKIMIKVGFYCKQEIQSSNLLWPNW